MKKILFFLIIKSSLCMAQDYKVMSDIELLDMIDDMNKQFEYQDQETHASIYRANRNKGFILLPAVGKKGLFAEQQSVLDSIIKKGVIPIEAENLNLFEKEKGRLEKINENIDYYLTDLNNKLQMSLTIDKEIDTSLYMEINKRIKSIDPEKAYSQFFLSLGVVVGEIVRKKVNGKWKLEKRYGYNPFYVPYITSGSNKNFLPWYKLAGPAIRRMFKIKKVLLSVRFQLRTKILVDAVNDNSSTLGDFKYDPSPCYS